MKHFVMKLVARLSSGPVRMIMDEGERNPKLLKLPESAADLQRR